MLRDTRRFGYATVALWAITIAYVLIRLSA